MLFRQILHRDLGCASYVVADGGEAAVVDPKWEIDDYLELAEAEGLEIRHIWTTSSRSGRATSAARSAGVPQ
jgi:hydroxyacylglutathione hydrolase